jgi:hypothetical protein
LPNSEYIPVNGKDPPILIGFEEGKDAFGGWPKRGELKQRIATNEIKKCLPTFSSFQYAPFIIYLFFILENLF